MKTLSEYVKNSESNKYWAIFDRDEVMYNFYYTKEDADEAATELNNDTPSIKYHVKEIPKSDIEKNN